MARMKRSYAATETVVQWVLGTKPNGKYLSVREQGPLTSNIEAAKVFRTDKSAKEALALGVPAEFRGKLRVIRVSRTTRESMEDRT